MLKVRDVSLDSTSADFARFARRLRAYRFTLENGRLYAYDPNGRPLAPTFTRSTTLPYLNSNTGLLDSAAINAAPIEKFAGLAGVRINNGKTNVALKSDDFTGWTAVNASLGSAVAGPDGGD